MIDFIPGTEEGGELPSTKLQTEPPSPNPFVSAKNTKHALRLQSCSLEAARKFSSILFLQGYTSLRRRECTRGGANYLVSRFRI